MITNKPPEEMGDEELCREVAEWRGESGQHCIVTCEDAFYSYCNNVGCCASGRDLDKDDSIFKWDDGDPPLKGCKGYRPYCTNIADAWALVEETQNSADDDALRDLSFLVQLAIMKKRNPCRAICEAYVQWKREEAGK